MRKKIGWILFVILVWSLLATGVILAQSAGDYDLSWWSIDGGGGQISAGSYALAGTAGQPDASAPLITGGYELTGGYWSGGAASISHIYLPMQTR